MRRATAIVMLLTLGAALLAGCGVSNTDKLTATTWYLMSGTEKSPSWQWTVPADAQGRYTIRFESDGRFTSQADCNQLAGTWQAPGSDRVSIVPGPMTMAFCGELSLDILYAGLLGQASNWNVVSTGMSLTLADGGRLDYTSVAPASPSPSTEPTTPEPTVTPTPTPEPTTTVTATTTATATATTTATATAHRNGDGAAGHADAHTHAHENAQAHTHTHAHTNGDTHPRSAGRPRPHQPWLAAHSLLPPHAAVRGGRAAGPAVEVHDPVP